MSGISGLVAFIPTEKRRYVYIVFFVIGLLVVLAATRYALLTYYERNWDEVVQSKTTGQLAEIEREFAGVQRSVRRVGAELAQYPVVIASLAGEATDVVPLFDQVAKVSDDQDVGIEVYNRQGVLIAWEGRSGPPHQREVFVALSGQLTSYVTRGPIYSQLFVATPVRKDGKILGVILVRRTIEVNYPLNNKYINKEGLAQELSTKLGVSVEFNFGEDAEPRKDGRYVSASLIGIDGRKVGVVNILRPARSSYLEHIDAVFDQVFAIVWTMLLGVVGIAAGRVVFSWRSVLLRSIVFTLMIWGARYIMLWVGFPSLLLNSGIFDPGQFASTFGGGLAKSIGEMTITALALLVNVILIARILLARQTVLSPWWHPKSLVLRYGVALIATTVVFLLLRGYGTIIHSAVFDSTLRYNDPRVIVPSFELGMMVFNLFLISFCLILVVVGLASFVVTLFRSHTRLRAWVLAMVMFAIAGGLLGILDANAVMTPLYRILFAAGILAFTHYLHRLALASHALLTLGNTLLALGLSALFFYPLLNAQVLQRDRDRVEIFAGEVIRPVDSWLKNVVSESLQGFQSDETKDILLSRNADEIDKLAFTHWAQSAASREGYNCLFGVVDSGGRYLSKFVIGAQSIFSSEERFFRQVDSVSITVEEIGSGANAMKVYGGVAPIALGRKPFAYGIVVVSAGQQSLFRGETPNILRSASQENIETFYRPIVISEFRRGKLFTSNNPTLPINYTLPEEVKAAFADSLLISMWYDEEIAGSEYETFYVHRRPGGNRIVALSLEKIDLLWHFFGIVKVIVYYVIVVTTLLIGYFILRWIQGRRYVFTFRGKLLIALLVTAVIPVAVIATYGRVFARERLMETIGRQLEQETATVAVNVLQRFQPNDSTLLPLGPDSAEQLATEAGSDFNLYIGRELQASSKPELYEAGILDTRLSGTAYAGIVIGGERFHLERENIGLYQYAVGYRPLLDENDRIMGIISVPTLYRQDELEEEVSKSNAFLFGIYAIVLIAILIIATTLANRIASPIHRLTEATKRVSSGDLDVRVRVPHAEGEVSELIRSFDAMTEDLKRSRDNLIRFEREMAWKEMAKQVAHEIKNPLTPMKLSLQHLRQTYRDKVPNFDQVFEEVSRTIIEQIDTLGRIASEFSHFARMPKPRLESCDVNEILQESVHLFEKDAAVTFEQRLQSGLPLITADREELRRAFINVIRNGIQAMGNTGRMVITTARLDGPLTVTIQDFGPGIPDEIQSRLFEPNFSTKTDGMGLGLALVKKTIEDLQGDIAIESRNNEGTTVTIHFPVAHENSSG